MSLDEERTRVRPTRTGLPEGPVAPQLTRPRPGPAPNGVQGVGVPRTSVRARARGRVAGGHERGDADQAPPPEHLGEGEGVPSGRVRAEMPVART